MIRSLFKQSGVYFFGLTFSKLLSVVVFILFARQLLPERFGDFVLYVTLLQIVTFLGDFGLNQWYQKQADLQDKSTLLNKIISSRILTLLFSIVISYFFLFVSSTFSLLVSILFLLTLIPEAFLSVMDGYFLEKKQSLRVSLKVTSKMGVIFVAFLIFGNIFNFDLAVESYFIASLLTTIWFLPWDKLVRCSFAGFNKTITTLKSSFSYAFLIFSSFLYARGDSLVVKYILGSSALGIYGGAYRYLESLSLLPTALSHNLFPISAKKTGLNLDQLKKIFLLTLMSGIIVSATVFLFSDFLITGLLGNAYASAIPVLKIFSLVLLLFFINAPLSTVVQSSRLINSFLPFGFLNTILNIVLNILFISRYGVVAAAWVMLTTEITGTFINLYFVKKLYQK